MNDSQNGLDLTRQRLPLRQLMTKHGHAPANDQWQDTPCPSSMHKSGAGLFKGDTGQELFRCLHTTRPVGKAFDEVGFLADVSTLSRADARVQYLKEAGVWKGERLAGVMTA